MEKKLTSVLVVPSSKAHHRITPSLYGRHVVVESSKLFVMVNQSDKIRASRAYAHTRGGTARLCAGTLKYY